MKTDGFNHRGTENREKKEESKGNGTRMNAD